LPALLDDLHKSETGVHFPTGLKTQLEEHSLHTLFTQVLHPESEGAAVFDGEYTHCPFTKSYPVKQVRQPPFNLSHVLQLSLTAMQIPALLK
jgi:hypothetical protein